MEKDCVRHGDILFRRTGTRPVGTARHSTSKVIAKGEATGHAHTLTEGEATILEYYSRDWRGDEHLTGRQLEVVSPTVVDHEEHGKTVPLLPGLWDIIQAKEFDYGANLGRRVVD